MTLSGPCPAVHSGGVQVAIGLGSSLGDRRHHLDLAVRTLAADPHLELLRRSRDYFSPPMRGGAARGWFLNCVALFRTSLDPEALLARCIRHERRAGRRRALHWGDRTLDLDVLHAESISCDQPDLVLPHPGIAHRSFVLHPLLEIWPDARHPITGVYWRDLPSRITPRAVPLNAVARARVVV
ncbi:MAG: 2-amino-4-hydroxy-6-hydroxymethyldihydropteridine diphosphokinase [Myxococcota bacterium]